ncbi:hypothetical protein JOE21_003067 [Desmospora profundinema]|uniref:Uncharacterized protein n=1 Tax=Desmospora profundinema TaxID=1571184 RepID=A0ABU1IQL0_9BACL|nr:hypothetical protein [Desmospora profundinema]
MNQLIHDNGLIGLVKEEKKPLLLGVDMLNDMGKVEDIIGLRSMIHDRGYN